VLTTCEKPPRCIGEYQVLELLGATDLTSVYKGLNPATGEQVAIKVASPLTASKPVLLKRFSQEFTMIKGLKHPHLIRALGFGNHDLVPYMVLEYVDGMSLGNRIEKEGALPEAEAVRIITQVAEALQYAHQQRIIHRDIKPDNILLTTDGVAKLADLGLAKDCDSEELLTRPSSGLGTPNFMAPEQFSDAKHADPRCDIYSLAATLYMAVTGTVPFQAKGAMSVLKKKLENALVPARKVVPSVSARVEAAILRAVDVNPRSRHSTCRQFIDDLNGRSTGGTPVVAAPARATKSSYERRATARLASTKEGRCQPLRAGEGGKWQVAVRDVSADGVGLVLPRRFEPRTVLVLELVAKEDEPAQRFLVRVVRVVPTSGRRWLHGCVFANRLSDEEVQALV
jgi:serine/threonine protein kinase